MLRLCTAIPGLFIWVTMGMPTLHPTIGFTFQPIFDPPESGTQTMTGLQTANATNNNWMSGP